MIGPVSVLAEARGAGIGAALIHAAVAVLAQVPRLTQARLGAQVHAPGFHKRLGLTLAGPVYTDAGIPHGDMVLALPPARGGPDGGPPRRG